MTSNDKDLLNIIRSDWILLMQSIDTLKLSLRKCESIGLKIDYTFEEQESMDSLTSKFARSSDIYTQKILRTIRKLLHESTVPFIDLVNNSEKNGIIQSADDLIDIRDLRNQISHEYIPEALQALIPEIFRLSILLLENIKTTEDFLVTRGWK